ncbi:MAG: ISAs1 family transposase, partial [Desulfovibrionaceae bacterium]|nr:ISAs1 family transposase [Desulfovibrionaceae bacterium]
MASQNKYSCPRLKKFVLLASKEDNKGTFLSLPYALRFVALSVGKVWRSSLKRELNSLKKFIPLENGVPLHDIVRGVFEQLNPKQQLVFKELVKFLNSETEGKFVAIVGKILIGTLNAVSGIAIIHTLSAWASESRLVLGGCDVDRKENEIAKIPYLLGMLEIKKAVVTIDAMGCQKNIAKLIVTKNKADYVLLSKNQ